MCCLAYYSYMKGYEEVFINSTRKFNKAVSFSNYKWLLVLPVEIWLLYIFLTLKAGPDNPAPNLELSLGSVPHVPVQEQSEHLTSPFSLSNLTNTCLVPGHVTQCSRPNQGGASNCCEVCYQLQSLSFAFIWVLIFWTKHFMFGSFAFVSTVHAMQVTIKYLPHARSARGRVIGLSVRISVCVFVCQWHKNEDFERSRPEYELYLPRMGQKWICVTFCVSHDRERLSKSSEKLCFWLSYKCFLHLATFSQNDHYHKLSFSDIKSTLHINLQLFLLGITWIGRAASVKD